MDEQLGWHVHEAIRSVKSEVAALNTTMIWAFFLAALYVLQSSPDVHDDLASCQATAIAAHLDISESARHLGYCMDGKGYDYTGAGCFGQASEACYEKRGAWRTTKVTARSWWDKISGWVMGAQNKP